jgi:exopolysaccharide biosynthesis polyprenyl glycosylphosphotransferase
MAWDANLPILFFAGFGLLHSGHPLAVLSAYPWVFFSVVAFPGAYALAGVYCERTQLCSRGAVLGTVAATLVVTLLMGGGFLLLGNPDEAGELFTGLTLTMLAGATGMRLLAVLRARSAPRGRTALVIGAGADGCAVIDCSLREPGLRVRVVGFVDDDPLKKNFEHKGVTVAGTGQSLEEAVAQKGVNLVVNAASGPLHGSLIRNLVHLKTSGVTVVEMSSFIESATGQYPIRQIDDAWLLYNQGFLWASGAFPPLWKRCVDVAAASFGILVALPLLAVISLAIKIGGRGPVFARHERIGQREKPFSLFRFRTRRASVLSRPGADVVDASDQRMTRIGRWLRRAHLDEIPQLGNVLSGEMSFVGPRPETPKQVEKLKGEIPCYGLRFAIQPGLVGWAQVQSGRRAADADVVLENLKYDLYYQKNMSPLLDLVVAHRAVRAVLFSRRVA